MVIPVGSIPVTRASCFGSLDSFVEIGFGAVATVVVVVVVVPVVDPPDFLPPDVVVVVDAEVVGFFEDPCAAPVVLAVEALPCEALPVEPALVLPPCVVCPPPREIWALPAPGPLPALGP